MPSRSAATAWTISLSQSTRAGSLSRTSVQSPSRSPPGARRTWGEVADTTGTPASASVSATSSVLSHPPVVDGVTEVQPTHCRSPAPSSAASGTTRTTSGIGRVEQPRRPRRTGAARVVADGAAGGADLAGPAQRAVGGHVGGGAHLLAGMLGVPGLEAGRHRLGERPADQGDRLASSPPEADDVELARSVARADGERHAQGGCSGSTYDGDGDGHQATTHPTASATEVWHAMRADGPLDGVGEGGRGDQRRRQARGTAGRRPGRCGPRRAGGTRASAAGRRRS